MIFEVLKVENEIKNETYFNFDFFSTESNFDGGVKKFYFKGFHWLWDNFSNNFSGVVSDFDWLTSAKTFNSTVDNNFITLWS